MKGQAIPIGRARDIAEQYGYDQVVILARLVGPAGGNWVTTYGRDERHCDAAAKIGAALRDNVTPTLDRLRARIAELEAQLAEIGA